MAKILIVEDCSELREWISEILRREGHEVTSSEDGDAALRQYRVARPDLVVLDIVIPPPDGMELVRLFKQIDAEASIIAISGDPMAADFLTLARTWGAVATLAKPFDGDRLRAEVDAQLSRTKNPDA